MVVAYETEAETLNTANSAQWVSNSASVAPDTRISIQLPLSGMLSLWESAASTKWIERALVIAEALIASTHITDSPDGLLNLKAKFPAGYTNTVGHDLGRSVTWTGTILNYNYESGTLCELCRLVRIIKEDSSLNASSDFGSRSTTVYNYLRANHINKMLDFRAYGRWFAGNVVQDPYVPGDAATGRTIPLDHSVMQMARELDDMVRASVAQGLTHHTDVFVSDTAATYNTWDKLADRLAERFKLYLVHPRLPDSSQWKPDTNTRVPCIEKADNVDTLVWDCGMHRYPRNNVDYRTDDVGHGDDVPWAVVSLYDQATPRKFVLAEVNGLAKTFSNLIYDRSTPIANPRFHNFIDGFNGEFRPNNGTRASWKQGNHYAPGWCPLAWLDSEVWQIMDGHLAALLAGTSTDPIADPGRRMAMCGMLREAEQRHTTSGMPSVLPTVTTPSLAVAKNSYEPGELLGVTIRNGAANERGSWVGLYATFQGDTEWSFGFVPSGVVGQPGTTIYEDGFSPNLWSYMDTQNATMPLATALPWTFPRTVVVSQAPSAYRLPSNYQDLISLLPGPNNEIPNSLPMEFRYFPVPGMGPFVRSETFIVAAEVEPEDPLDPDRPVKTDREVNAELYSEVSQAFAKAAIALGLTF